MFSTALPHSCPLKRHQKIHLYNQLPLSHFNLLCLESCRHPSQATSYDTTLVICNLIRMHNSSLTAPVNWTSVELSAEALQIWVLASWGRQLIFKLVTCTHILLLPTVLIEQSVWKELQSKKLVRLQHQSRVLSLPWSSQEKSGKPCKHLPSLSVKFSKWEDYSENKSTNNCS